MTVGEIITKARIEKNMTQKELGVACGYDEKLAQTYVSKWEAGTRPIPRVKLRIVADSLGIPLEQLL